MPTHGTAGGASPDIPRQLAIAAAGLLAGALAAPAVLALLAWGACSLVKADGAAADRAALEQNIRRGVYADPVCETCGMPLSTENQTTTRQDHK